MDDHGVHGPSPQVAMFADGQPPPTDPVVAFAYNAPLTFAEIRWALACERVDSPARRRTASRRDSRRRGWRECSRLGIEQGESGNPATTAAIDDW